MKATDRREKIAVIVGTVTNDIRILTVPKLTVCQSFEIDINTTNVLTEFVMF